MGSDGPNRHTGIYVGSFDPITRGHLDVLARARRLFDRIVVGIGHNPDKSALFTFEERTDMVRTLVDELLRDEPDGAPVDVASYTGLTVDFATEHRACAIIRGIRNITDLASETQLAITNRQVADIETVFIVTGEAYAFTSSSLIRQIAAHGGSLDRLETIVPPLIIDRIRAKANDADDPLSRLRVDRAIE
ncbi:MAG: pantetheine-phosphate adenylyltransferase [Planctomycetota bacterium]